MIVFLLLLFLFASAAAQTALLPDARETPGAVDPALTQSILCNSAFSTSAYRHVSKSVRKCALARYGMAPGHSYTYDHLIPLELGGANTCDNIWPQPRADARKKDKLENALQAHVCACHGLTLAKAQDLIRTNWSAAYAKYVTPKGTALCAVNP